MVSNIFFVIIASCLIALSMFAVSYEPKYKTIKMLDMPDFISMFILFTFISLLVTAILFKHPLLVLSIIGLVMLIGGVGFGIYHGLLYLKDFLDTRGK